MKILIVDDEKLVREGLSSLAQTYAKGGDPEIVTAENAYVAQERLRSFQPDIVFVDIQMPGRSGLSLIEEMQRMRLDSIVIIVSGHADFAYAQQAISLDVADYLLKPVSPHKFRAVYEKAQVKKQHSMLTKLDTSALRSNIRELREQLVAGLILEMDLLDEESLRQRMGSLNMNIERYCIGYVRKYNHGESWNHAVGIREALYEALSGFGEVYVICNDIGAYVFLVAFFSFSNPDELDAVCGRKLSGVLGGDCFIRLSVPDNDLGNASSHYMRLLLDFQGENKPAERPAQSGDPVVRLLTRQGLSSITRAVVEYVISDYHADLSLESAAHKVYVHPAYLSDLFKREAGENFSAFLNSYRIHKAKGLLLQKHYKVYVVASMVGFNDQRYFSTVFKRYTGLTPVEYREKHILPK